MTPGTGIRRRTRGTRRLGADEHRRRLGLVYLPVEFPTHDTTAAIAPETTFQREHRRGELKTGQRRWHYQLVHHGMWDMDIPCAPVLMDITVNGRPVKALAQATKQAFCTC